MKYLSICSGIEAATVAWHPLGWQPVAFAEIEKFPSTVLAHHYPHVPNLGDITKFREWPDATVDVLVGGTPCQSFSVAGLRAGMADPRGNLALVYLAIADRYKPRWLVWENVPGVLSSNGGRDFAAFIGGLEQLGYHAAWRVLDAQHVRVDGFARAVPQRRRRVFVVGYSGDWRRAAAVLFERESLQWDTAPRRKAGERASVSVAPCLRAGGNATGGDRPYGTDVDICDSLIASTGDVAHCLNAGAMGRIDYETETMVAHALKADGFDASKDGTGRGTPLVPAIAFDARQSDVIQYGDKTGPLDTDGHTMAVAYGIGSDAVDRSGEGANGTAAARSGLNISEGIQPALRARPNNAVAYGLRSDAGREGSARTPSPDAEGRVRLRDPGFNVYEGHAPTLDAGAPHAVAFTCSDQANGFAWERDVWQTLDAQVPNDSSNIQRGIRQGWAVRRLTPRECERLQGFPDDYTAIPVKDKPAADGPRYKALGNSMACNVMRWIGYRIQLIEDLKKKSKPPGESP